MSHRRLIIADAHVGTVSGDAAAMISLLDEAAAAGIAEVIFLGDTFQYLIGMSKFWTQSVVAVLACWDRIRAGGMTVRLIEGNRDFFLDEADLAAHIDEAAHVIDFTAGDTAFRLVHGDKVNGRDFQYLFWSKLSKCSLARVWARWLPQSLAVRIVRSMEARLAETNRKFRYSKPVAALRAAAERAFDGGVDVLLFGHFHTLWLHERDGKTAMVVPAWLETRTALMVEADGEQRWVDGRCRPSEPDFEVANGA